MCARACMCVWILHSQSRRSHHGSQPFNSTLEKGFIGDPKREPKYSLVNMLMEDRTNTKGTSMTSRHLPPSLSPTQVQHTIGTPHCLTANDTLHWVPDLASCTANTHMHITALSRKLAISLKCWTVIANGVMGDIQYICLLGSDVNWM